MTETIEGGRVIEAARGWIGTPYVHQASTPGHGCDCLGLVRGVWRTFHGSEPQPMPGYTRDFGEAAGDENILRLARERLVAVEPANMQPGDLLVFRWRHGAVAKHMGFLAAGPSLIHAWERGGVVEVPLVPAWKKRIAGVFRLPAAAKE
jgi:NlpC/P60 family putative phage cell wall peptidase